MTTVSAGHDQRRRAGCGPRPAPLTAVLEQTPVDHHPARQSPLPRLAAPRPMQLSVGVDVVVVAGPRSVFAAPRPSANPMSMTPIAGADQRQVVATPRRRAAPDWGETGLDIAYDGDQQSPRSKMLTMAMPKGNDDQRSRDHRFHTPGRPMTTTSESNPIARVVGVGVPEVGRGSQPCLLEEVALTSLDAEELGELSTMMVRARPMMNPLSTGSEMKLAMNPRRRIPARSAIAPVTKARTMVKARNSPSSVVRSATIDAERARRCRHRTGHQMAGAPEDGIEDQGGWGGVQPDHRREAPAIVA